MRDANRVKPQDYMTQHILNPYLYETVMPSAESNVGCWISCMGSTRMYSSHGKRWYKISAGEIFEIPGPTETSNWAKKASTIPSEARLNMLQAIHRIKRNTY